MPGIVSLELIQSMCFWNSRSLLRLALFGWVKAAGLASGLVTVVQWRSSVEAILGSGPLVSVEIL